MSTSSSRRIADHNEVRLFGSVRTDPTWYDRPEGEACCFELDIAEDDSAATRVPIAWIEPPRRATIVRSGARLAVAGRIHQRFFRAEGRTLARLEVVAVSVVPARNRRRVEALLGGVVG